MGSANAKDSAAEKGGAPEKRAVPEGRAGTDDAPQSRAVESESSAVLGAFSCDDVRLRVPAADCREAIQRAADVLIEEGKIAQGYVKEMYEAFDTYGPYFVLAPGMAFAHSKPSASVLATGLSLVTLEHPVPFGSEANDPVWLVCVIASRNSSEHLAQLKRVVGFLADERAVGMLRDAKTEKDLEEVVRALNAS